jgi:hypothetical protein
VTAPPQTPTERLLAGAWCEVLGLPAVDATESFFDVGGASVTMVAVQHRLRALTGREVRIVDLFRFPTVRTLAAFLDGDAGAGTAELDRAAQRGAARRSRSRHPVPRGPERGAG